MTEETAAVEAAVVVGVGVTRGADAVTTETEVVLEAVVVVADHVRRLAIATSETIQTAEVPAAAVASETHMFLGEARHSVAPEVQEDGITTDAPDLALARHLWIRPLPVRHLDDQALPAADDLSLVPQPLELAVQDLDPRLPRSTGRHQRDADRLPATADPEAVLVLHPLTVHLGRQNVAVTQLRVVGAGVVVAAQLHFETSGTAGLDLWPHRVLATLDLEVAVQCEGVGAIAEAFRQLHPHGTDTGAMDVAA